MPIDPTTPKRWRPRFRGGGLGGHWAVTPLYGRAFNISHPRRRAANPSSRPLNRRR